MKIKTPYTLAAIFAVSLLASGCSQMAAQPAEPAAKPAEPKTVVDCSKCNKTKAPAGGAHTHPAIPGCTDSTTHTHPFTNANHKHAYSCKGGKKVAPPKKGPAPKQPPAPTGKWNHTHPAIPGCTDSISHSHPYTNAQHTHHYSCKGGNKQQVEVPQVKAKGNYKGPVQIDTGVMQTYKKQ